jgi:glycosyltransferase involved in cell wall biosynthesis
MALKISVFTTMTNPTVRGDHWKESLESYRALADEVIVVNGGENPGITKFDKVKIIYNEWPKEFNWPFIGEQFQRGYERATGDWVIHADLDMIFHEQDFSTIRQAFKDHPNQPGLSFWKYQFILPDRYNLKSRLVLAVNKKKYGDRIRFDSGGDLCQPSLDGEQIPSAAVAEARVPIYNYEKMTKTADQVMDDCGRMERAYQRHFGTFQMGSDGSDESDFDKYIKLLRGRFQKPQEFIKLSKHPKYVQETISKLRPEQFGFDGFGLLKETNSYAMGNLRD